MSKKTNAELEKEILHLKAQLAARKENSEKVTILEQQNKLLESHLHAAESELHRRDGMSPEYTIVSVLEKLEIPDQVALLHQVSAKKLLQWREAQQKHATAAKFMTNNIEDMERNMASAISGRTCLMPS